MNVVVVREVEARWFERRGQIRRSVAVGKELCESATTLGWSPEQCVRGG